MYCPERWRTFEKWKSRNVDIMNEAKPYISKLFHDSGPKKTTPDCLVKLVADYDPTNGKTKKSSTVERINAVARGRYRRVAKFMEEYVSNVTRVLIY